ncbi:MAG: biotin--[acetyl-CoA-carboxylase] ligase [Asgard group archaeon]|nr:biotin--[acetyl-CoA-carboxylase] ligase [Asgard group archaeon]
MKTIHQMNVIDFKSLESTQKTAREFIKTKRPCHRLVIIAEEQIHGIGRLNRKWISPKGGIWMSSIFQQEIPLEIVRGFSIRIGLLLAMTLTKKLDLSFKVKWPNDLILADKKIGGILTEINSISNMLNYLIVGIGINVNIPMTNFPIHLANTATSISNEIGHDFSLEKIKDIIIKTNHDIFSELESRKLTDLSSIWNDWSITYEKEIQIKSDDEEILGVEKGITKFGDLSVNLKDGTRKNISIGEITLLRKSS